jgi:signal transduction histidine kinase
MGHLVGRQGKSICDAGVFELFCAYFHPTFGGSWSYKRMSCSRFTQVILNLILNAIEAMSEGYEGSRELLISTDKAEADAILVKVSDSGPGLPQANRERIFDAFYTTKASGSGMGLSICRSIVEAHGGRLWATPNEPYGAIFFMMLPVTENSLENLA